jgi:hypothetical protein
MGIRYISFRIGYELKMRTGWLKQSFPVNPKNHLPISLDVWRQNKITFLYDKGYILKDVDVDKKKLREAAVSILEGDICFFNSTKVNLGKGYDWLTNPSTNFTYDKTKHWSEIKDYSLTHGDIKFVWEKSRFTYIYTLIRDEYFNNQDHAVFIFDEIESWIDNNPINCGPNYKCSQEISLRTLNWIFALYFYADSNALTSEKWNKIINVIYWQIHHVYKNINFSRIAVRNNHAITETLTLYIVGTLFPWFRDAAKWKVEGKKWFEKEVAYQIYEDGTFLQFSMNYHRVVIQLLTLAFRISETNNESFSDLTYERAYKSLDFLFQCQEPSNGNLPNYGSNDGALFFPLNGCDYNDFRPQLNALHVLLCGTPLYSGEYNNWNEDSYWLGINSIERRYKFSPLIKLMGCISFDVSGYYLIRELNSFTFLRCGNHKDRPLQADNLHIDIWVNGHNVLHDAGSYKYNTDETNVKYFMGSAGHNTVMLNDFDQMKKGARFIWYYWTQCNSAKLVEDSDAYYFSGSIKAFQFINKKITHKRMVRKIKNSLTWIISDEIEEKPVALTLVQRWHYINNWPLLITSSGENVEKKEITGYYSRYYGEKKSCNEVLLSTNNSKIETRIIAE